MLELVLLCAGCHGLAGEGRPEAGYPPLAGATAAHLEQHLDAYASGRKPDRIMTPLARRLTPAERRALAEHFAGLPPRAAHTGR